MIDAAGNFDDPLREALACADLGVFEVDLSRQSVKLDLRGRELLGIARDAELSLETLLAVVDPEDRVRVAEHLRLVAVNGDPYHQEFRIPPHRWIAFDGRPRAFGTGDGVTIVGLLQDVTLRRAKEDAQARLIEEMTRSLRFNDMLVGTVVHDLRSPLAAVLTTAELIATTTKDAAWLRLTSRIKASTQRMSSIVDQLLDLTPAYLDGRVPLKTRSVELQTIVRTVAFDVMAAHPGSSVEVESHSDTRCHLDPERMAQALFNLVGNAARHGDDPRSIRIVVNGTSVDAVAVSVMYPGVIPAELLAVFFNPFHNLKEELVSRSNRGRGLGLYIARQIVLGHAGIITAASNAAHGTTFNIELPRTGGHGAFMLSPDLGEGEAIALQRLGIYEHPSRITASLFGLVPLQERAPETFGVLVEHHARLVHRSLDRQIYRDVRVNLSTDLREIAEQLGGLGASAGDVAELHSQALQLALKQAPALKATALATEGRLVALELMGRLLTYYRNRAGFGGTRSGSDV